MTPRQGLHVALAGLVLPVLCGQWPGYILVLPRGRCRAEWRRGSDWPGEYLVIVLLSCERLRPTLPSWP